MKEQQGNGVLGRGPQWVVYCAWLELTGTQAAQDTSSQDTASSASTVWQHNNWVCPRMFAEMEAAKRVGCGFWVCPRCWNI